MNYANAPAPGDRGGMGFFDDLYGAPRSLGQDNGQDNGEKPMSTASSFGVGALLSIGLIIWGATGFKGL